MKSSRGSSKRPRVAIVLPNMKPGGAERNRLLLANSLVERSIDVDLVLRMAVGELLSELDPRVRVVDLKAKQVRGALVPLWSYFRRERPDAALVAMWPLTVVAAVARAFSLVRMRFVVSEHTTLSRSPVIGPGIKRLLTRVSLGVFYRLADDVIAVSRGVGDDLAAFAIPALPSPRVVYNEARFAGRGMGPIGAGLDGAPGVSTFICVGSLKPAKDHQTLLQAFSLVRKQIESRLVIVGDGPERPNIERGIEGLGISGSVELLGYRGDVGDLIGASDTLVLSSKWEGFPNVLVEALSLGTQVVSTDCFSGPSEILENGQFGRLVPVGDAKALATAMMESIDSPMDRASLMASVARFSKEAFVGGYLEALALQSGNEG